MAIVPRLNGSLSIGVTTQSKEQVISMDNATQMLGQTFLVTSSVGKASSALYVGGQV